MRSLKEEFLAMLGKKCCEIKIPLFDWITVDDRIDWELIEDYLDEEAILSAFVADTLNKLLKKLRKMTNIDYVCERSIISHLMSELEIPYSDEVLKQIKWLS